MISQPRLRHRGFTLLELVVVIVVFSIAAVPLSLLLIEHIEGAVYSSNKALALQLARYDMETVNNLAYASVATATFSSFLGYGFDVTRTVSYAAGTSSSTESLKQILVEVKKTGSATVLASMITYRAKNVLYGK
jgi:prepilin-type N-terminal cleavage/methylation domain-containing protein